MIPILWRYLLKQYLKVFLLTTTSFVLILFVTRFKEIAKMVALTPEPKYIFLFMLNIVPFILPIAIPIACLLSAILLYHKLSSSHELTAMRSCGCSLFTLTFPVLATATLLSFANFLVVSELTTHSQLYSKKLINDLISKNPFYLIENRGKLKLRDFYVDMMIEERGKEASNLFLVAPNKSDTHLNLISIEKLSLVDDHIEAPTVNIITSIPDKDNNGYDHLIIENEKNISTSAKDLTKMLKNSHLRLYSNHFSLPFLIISNQKLKQDLIAAKHSGEKSQVKKIKKQITHNTSEIIMRTSIGIAAFTFTLLGASFSIDIGRNRKLKKWIFMISLALLSLICLFAGKIVMQYLYLSLIIYLAPHLMICIAALYQLIQISRGIE